MAAASLTEAEEKLFGIDKLNIKRSEIPAVNHIDYSARIQTFHEETNTNYYQLIKEFKKPITSTSVNITGDRFPECFDEIKDEILNQIDYTVNLKRNEKLKTPSQIIKIVGDSFKILRS